MILSIDTETTGVSVKTDRIIQFGAFGVGVNVSRYVNPGIPIPPAASMVNRIYDHHVEHEKRFAEHAEEFLSLLNQATLLVGFNILAFDIPILQAEFKRVGPGIDWEPSCPVLDVMKVFHQQFPRNLTGAAKIYCDWDHSLDAHDALEDAAMVYRVMSAMMPMYNVENAVDLIPLASDPDAIDKAGKFKRVGEVIAITFGKHAGQDVKSVPKQYLAWMDKEGMIDEATKEILKAYLKGK